MTVVVCFTDFTRDQKDSMLALGIKSYSWNEFLKMVRLILLQLYYSYFFLYMLVLIFSMQGKEYPTEPHPPRSHDVCTIMYTSGTMGNPKGVILTHDNIAHYVNGVDVFMDQFEEKVSQQSLIITIFYVSHVLTVY